MDEERPAQQAPSRASSSSAAQPTDCPDGGYGWVCVACVFAINGFTWGVVAVRVRDVPHLTSCLVTWSLGIRSLPLLLPLTELLP